MDSRPLFSIIVPCYNVEAYVAETIESVLGQDYNKWELILINDGSKDSTLDILKRYSQDDKRIIVKDTPNGGVSKARNLGLSIAQGDWILFLDSDDWFECNALSIVYKYIRNHAECDVFGFNHYYNSEKHEWKQKAFQPSLLKRKGEEIEWFKLDMMFPYYDAVMNGASVGAIRGVWGKAFRASIIKDNHLQFIENLKISEDAIFCLEAFGYAREVILFDEYLTHYRLHSSSTISKYTPDVMEINDMALRSYAKYRNTFHNQENFDRCYLGMVSECIFRTFKLFLLHRQCRLSYYKRKQLFMGG